MQSAPWFDREEILSLLQKRAEGFLAGYRQNLAFLGPEGIGKSTLLKRFLRQQAGAFPSLIPLYVEVQEEEGFSEWTARFVRAVLCGVLEMTRSDRVQGSDLFEEYPPELPDLMRICSSAVPQTVSAAKRLLELAEAKRIEEAYDQLWDLPQGITQEMGASCLLVLDEFHRLKALPLKDPFGRLGRKIMMQSSTLYLAASSQAAAARSILREGLSLLFGQFETVPLGPLDPAVCLKAIRTVMSLKKADPFLEYLMVELAQGIPGTLDHLLQGWMDHSVDEVPENAERSLLDLLESLLLAPEGSLRVGFETRIRALPAHQSRRVWMAVLTAVAGGNHRVSQIAEAIGRSPSQVTRALKALEQAGLVEKQGVFCRVPDRLFQLWMITAYPVLRGLDLTDPARARARFRDVTWAWLAGLREAGRRPLEQHGLALLRQWGGELVEIEGRRIYLPRFDRVELYPRSPGQAVIVAHRSRQKGRGWLAIPWNGPLEEGQSRSLVKEISTLPFKEYRKVILGAHPVEVNARLVFQEARIRLWDLATFNNLLDLYGLARIPFLGTHPPGFFERIPIGPGGAPSQADLSRLPIRRAR